MTIFSAHWLALREAADHRARNARLGDALRSWFLQRDTISVVDLGCGTGSNLRATAALLPDTQRWTLVDHDPALLAAARAALVTWADHGRNDADQLMLTKGRAEIAVTFRRADLATDIGSALGPAPGPDLVTASALFDITSAAFIRRFASEVARRRAVFLTVLTYNGHQGWTPRHPADRQITAAFHRHQMTDKGFGPAAGPTAPVELSEAFNAHGYSVSEGGSPWRLTSTEAALISELARGTAAAVRETGALSESEVETWLARVHTAAEVGHTDTLAIPGSASEMDMGRDGDE